MKIVVALALALLAPLVYAGSSFTSRVPEPETWSLIGVTAAAFAAARYLRRRNRDARK